MFPAAWSTVTVLQRAIHGADFTPLERHSPGLKGYNWEEYLRCSVVRIVRALRALTQHVGKPACILDFGAYFGNFSIACRNLGYQVDAGDFYGSYNDAFSGVLESLRERGIGVLDFNEIGPDLPPIPIGRYDAVLCMGVIEHIAHTPRGMLETVNRVLKPGGILILDTPNVAYIYKRKQLMRGKSIFPDIATQFHAEPPFEGHHREYTTDEIRWMLEQIGHEVLSTESFCYSLYSLDCLQNEDLENYRLMEQDPASREVILSVSKKPQ